MMDRIFCNRSKCKTFAILIVFEIGLSFFMFSGCNNNEFSHTTTYMKSTDNSLSIILKDDSIKPEGLIVVITNNTNSDISYDTTFIVEEKRNGKWYRRKENQYFNALGIILNANSSSEFPIKFDEKLSKGNYRIVKPFVISSKTIYFDVEFGVEGE